MQSKQITLRHKPYLLVINEMLLEQCLYPEVYKCGMSVQYSCSVYALSADSIACTIGIYETMVCLV